MRLIKRMVYWGLVNTEGWETEDWVMLGLCVAGTVYLVAQVGRMVLG